MARAAKDYKAYIIWKENGLANYAAKSADARAAIYNLSNPHKFSLAEESYRTPFEIDSDMIIQSRYFPLLSRKTQIFIAPEDCHYRNRNSHTLTVVRLAKNISNGLKLNPDLTESISFGHDIGHMAFGHSGERELDLMCKEEYCILDFNELKTARPKEYLTLRKNYEAVRKNNPNLTGKEFMSRLARVKTILKRPEDWGELEKSFMLQDEDTAIFNHSRQGFRLLCLYAGKNVCAQTMYGIAAHNLSDKAPFEIRFEDKRSVERPRSILKEKYDERKPVREEKYLLSPRDATLEAQTVKFADYLAFTMHDFDDAIRAGAVSLDQVKSEFNSNFRGKYSFDKYFGVHRYTEFVNEFVAHNLGRKLEKIVTDALTSENILEIPPKTKEILSWLYAFIKKTVHTSPDTIQNIKRLQSVNYVRYAYDLFKAYRYDPHMLNEVGLAAPELDVKFSPHFDELRTFCDLISFKTDDDLIELGETFLSPKTKGKRRDL